MRGTGGDLIIAEEFAFMNNMFYKTVIVPILAANASFIGITTLGTETNFVNRLFDLKNAAGEPVFNTVKIEQVCNNCLRLGVESSCTHKMNEIPPWQSQQRHKDIKLILGDDEETFLRETRGVQSNSAMTQVFTKEDVKAFRNRIHPAGIAQPTLFIAVDPAAGGSGSKFAVVSCFFYESRMIVSFSFSAFGLRPSFLYCPFSIYKA